jgi:alkylation response protein AidB-like acyl-CoA dehydrogenase
MDVKLSKEQKLIRTSAKEFLQAEVPKDMVRELEETDTCYSKELWQKMADLGWIGLIIPEEYHGMGMDFLDLVVLLEETGYNLLPGPFFSTVIGTYPIVLAGTKDQKHKYLPKIAKGELKVTLALTEPTATYDTSGLTVEAIPEGDDYIINGTKLFVENAHISDYLVCAVRTAKKASPKEGVTLFIIDSNTRGIKTTVLPTIGIDRQCEVTLTNVRCPGSNLLGDLHDGWKILEKILERGCVAKCAEMLGGMRAALDMTNRHVKKRMTYGRLVGSYQVVQHYLANAWIDVETSKDITYLAAWKVDEGLPNALEVSAAKAWVGEAFARVTQRCVQLHGAIGLTREHDIGLYYRNAKAWDLAFGDGNFHREVIAREKDMWCS